MKKKFRNKMISESSIAKIKKKQKEMQIREFAKKGRKAHKVHFYQALDAILRGVSR